MARIYFDVELEDHEPVRVRILHIDTIVAERELVRRGQSLEASPVEGATLLAWSALRRHPDISVPDFETFCAQVVRVDKAVEEDVEPADPTQTGQPGSP